MGKRTLLKLARAIERYAEDNWARSCYESIDRYLTDLICNMAGDCEKILEYYDAEGGDENDLQTIIAEEADAAAAELDAWTAAANRQESRIIQAIAQSKKEWQRGAVNHLRDRLLARLTDFEQV